MSSIFLKLLRNSTHGLYIYYIGILYRDTFWILYRNICSVSLCLACLLHWYVRASEMFPAGLTGDATFVSNTARTDRGNKFYNLTPDALAAIMKRNMKEAGVPEDFLPHSARAAGMAFHKKGGYTEDMVLARANMSSRTYKLHYERQIRRLRDCVLG